LVVAVRAVEADPGCIRMIDRQSII
jgi:hypothetical protein